MANDHRSDGQGPAREDRRGHDGLQGRARRDRRRHGGRRRLAAQEGPCPRPPRRPDRVAAEGLIGSVIKGTKGVVVEVNSETDFVARNDQFQGLVKMIAKVALDVGGDVEKIKAAKAGSRHGRGPRSTSDRHDRREHDAAPRRRARGRQGRGRELCAQCRDRGPRQDRRAGRAGVDRQGGRTRRARPPGRHACRRRQPAGGRSPPGSIPRRSKREKDVLAEKYVSRASPRT